MVRRFDFADVGFLLALAAFVDCERLVAVLAGVVFLLFVDVAALVEVDFELKDALGLALALVDGVPVFGLDFAADLELLVFKRVDVLADLAVALGLAGVFFVAADFLPLETVFFATDLCGDFAAAFFLTGFRADFAGADLAAVLLDAGLAIAFVLVEAAFVAVFLAFAFAVVFRLALLAAGLGFGFVVEDFEVAFLAVADLAATLATDFLAGDFLAALDFVSLLGDLFLVVGDCPCASLPSDADALDCVDSADSVALSSASLFDSVGNVIFDSLHDAQEWKSAKLPKNTPDC